MSRYLTPCKIALLGLAVLYTENVVPTSETTSILSFIITHLLPRPSDPSAVSGVDVEDVVPISEFEIALASHVSARPGRTIFDLLLKKLWAIDCSDALDAFITDLPSVLSKSREQMVKERETGDLGDHRCGRILRTSPLGAFIRRCHLEYTRLQFQDSTALWQDFIAYRAPTRLAYEKKNPPDGRNALDVNLSGFGLDASHPGVLLMYSRLLEQEEQQRTAGFSTYDIEKLLEFQVSEMQRMSMEML